MSNEKKLTSGYNKMMERVQAYYASSGSSNALQEALEFGREQAITKDELNEDEAEKVAKFVSRDINAAAEFLIDSDKNLADWFKFDIELIEARLWEMFSSVADQTKLELMNLAERAKLMSEYHAGEVSGPATLQCSSCKHLTNIHKTQKITECSNCNSTVFTRYSFDDEQAID